jgi:ribonuclease P protein component
MHAEPKEESGYLRNLMNVKFPAQFRLRDKEQIKTVFARGKKLADHNITILFVANNLLNPRVVIIIGKKILRRAVDRNLFRRISREVFRKLHTTVQCLDLVILAKPKIARCTREQIKQCLIDSITKLILQLKK